MHLLARSALVSIAILLLAQLLLAEQAGDLRYTSVVMNVTTTWTISSDAQLEEAHFDLLMPNNSSNQEVLSMELSVPYSIVNDRLIIDLQDVTNTEMRGNFIVKADYINRRNVTALTETQLDSFLNETKLVVITRKIAAQANKFSNLFPDMITEMSDWVYGNVEYALPYSDVNVSDVYEKTIPSDWVFENRIGVCDEFSHLFIAMARAREIPARVVSGFVRADNDWIPHSWAEVFVDPYGWVEVDPTFDEFLNLGAMRLRIGSGADQSAIADKVSATTSSTVKNMSFTTKTEITVINSSKGANVSLDVRFPQQEQLSQTQPVIIGIRNSENAPVYTKITVSPPRNIECNCTMDVFLGAGERQTHIFTLQLPALTQNVRYTFPVSTLTEFSEVDAEFSRALIVESGVNSQEGKTPISFRYFIGIFFIAMLGLVIIAILRRW